MNSFNATITGSFHSFKVYDQDGKEIYYLDQAIDYLETTYPEESGEVFNGQEGGEWGLGPKHFYRWEHE
jgi:hypothetical protein